jgi:hypothetical protein
MFTAEPARASVVGWEGGASQIDLPADSYSAMFLGRTLVTYVNPLRKNTFGPDAARPVRACSTWPGGRTEQVEGGLLSGELARQVRNGGVRRLVVELG